MKLNHEKKVVLKPYKVFDRNNPPKEGKYIVVLNGDPRYTKISNWREQEEIGGKGYMSWDLGTATYSDRVTHYAPVPKLYATNKVIVYK